MKAVVSLDTLLADRQIWRGQRTSLPAKGEPTGHAVLDAALPTAGWPEAGLVEVLTDKPGLGEMRLVLPSLARCSQQGRVILLAPPFLPYPPSWTAAGIDLRRVGIVETAHDQVLWATEQCLRSGAVAAVLVWPGRVEAAPLRRLQVAAEAGRALAFVFRDAAAGRTPSPAPLRIAVERQALRVLKCRGGKAPERALPFPPA